MARRAGATFSDVLGVPVQQRLKQAEPGAGTAGAEVGVAVQALQRPPQPTDRRQVVQPVPEGLITDRKIVLAALHTVRQASYLRLPAKPRRKRALSGQQRSQRLHPKRCRYPTIKRGKNTRIA